MSMKRLVDLPRVYDIERVLGAEDGVSVTPTQVVRAAIMDNMIDNFLQLTS